MRILNPHLAKSKRLRLGRRGPAATLLLAARLRVHARRNPSASLITSSRMLGRICREILPLGAPRPGLPPPRPSALPCASRNVCGADNP
jgi:hypothetical protein